MTRSLLLTFALSLSVAACGDSESPAAPEAPATTAAPKAADQHHGDMKHGDTKHGDMKHGDMKHGDMKHGDMQHGDMKHGDMKHGDMKHGDGPIYACPMHPDVTGEEGDDCGKCGMKLTPMEEHDHSGHGHDDKAAPAKAD